MAAWRAYAETFVDLTAALEADLAEHGLTLGDYQVLVYLSEADDHRLRMCDLAERLQLSPSGLTRRLDGLTRAGFVERLGSPHDRRVMLAVLTGAGMRKLQRVAPAHVASVRSRLLDHVRRSDLPALARAFRGVRGALDEDADHDADEPERPRS